MNVFTPVKSYTQERKEEWSMRDWMPLNEKGEQA